MLEIKYVLLHNKIRKSVVNFKERRENMQKVKRMAAKIIASILNRDYMWKQIPHLVL